MTNIFVKLLKAVQTGLGGGSKTLTFQGRLNLDQNAMSIIESFSPLFAEQEGNSKCILDFTGVDFIYPSMILFLISLQEVLSENGVELEISLAEGSSLHEYLTYCGFGDFFSIPEFPQGLQRTISNPEEVFRMQSGPRLADTQLTAERAVDWFKLRQPLSPKVEADIIDSIDEILRNIAQHSNYSTYYLLGQAYPQSNRVRFTVYDNGIGIKSHITQSRYDQMHKRFRELISEDTFNEMKTRSANVAIVHAAKYEVSGTDYTRNSGAGLDFLINTLSPPTNSLVSIFSEDGYVRWESGRIVENFPLPYKTKGTLVSLTINCNPDSILRYRQEETMKGHVNDGK